MKDGRFLLVLLVIFVVLVGALLYQDRSQDKMLESTPTVTPRPTPSLTRIFPDLEVLQLSAIQLLLPGTDRELTIARDVDGTWITPNINATLQDDAGTTIARLVVLLPYTRKFEIETDADMQQYGFKPSGDVWIQFVTVEGEKHIVAVGEPTLDKTGFYALVDDLPEVYIIERAPLDYLVNYLMQPPIEN